MTKSVCRVCGRSFKKEFDYCPFCGSKKEDPTARAKAAPSAGEAEPQESGDAPAPEAPESASQQDAE